MNARISVLTLFLWCCFVAWVLPYTEGAQGAWLFVATLVHGIYTCIKVSDLYASGGKL